MRYLVGALALAPFVLLLVAMVTGRAQVRPCCPPAPGDAGAAHEVDGEGERTASAGRGADTYP